MRRFPPVLMLLHTTVVFEEGNLPTRTAREMKNVYPEPSQKSRMSVFRDVELDLCASELHDPRLKSSLGKMKCWSFPIAPIPRAHQRLAEIHFLWLGYEHIYKGLTWARQSWKMIWLKYFIPCCLLDLCLPLFLDNKSLSLMGLYAF